MKPHTALLVAVLFLVSSLCTAGRSSAVPEFERATRLSMRGDMAGAVKEYESFLDSHPTDRLASVAAAAAVRIRLEELRDTTGALTLLDRLLAGNPSCPWGQEAAQLRGLCLERQQRWIEAGESYRRALDLAGRCPDQTKVEWARDVTQRAAGCYSKTDQPEKAAEMWRSVLGSSPSPEIAPRALAQLAAIYEAQGDSTAAADAYLRLIREYPSSELFPQAYAKRPLIERFHKLDWSLYAIFARGSALIAKQDFAAVLPGTDSILAGPADPPLRECAEYRKIVIGTTVSGDYYTGSQQMRDFLAHYPNGLRASMARERLERWKPIEDLETGARTRPDDFGAQSLLGEIYMEWHFLDRAAPLLEKALALNPEDARTHFLLAHLYAATGQTAKAIEFADSYAAKDPEGEGALNTIGYYCIQQGHPEYAIPLFEKQVERASENPEARDSLGEGYFRAGRFQESAAEYEKAVALKPDLANSHFMLGQVYQSLGRAGDARAAYEAYLRLAPQGEHVEETRAAMEKLSTSGSP